MSDPITEFLRTKIAEEIGVPIEEVGDDVEFDSLGMSSLNAVLICGEIEDQFETEVDPSLMFENRTVSRMRAALDPLLVAARG